MKMEEIIQKNKKNLKTKRRIQNFKNIINYYNIDNIKDVEFFVSKNNQEKYLEQNNVYSEQKLVEGSNYEFLGVKLIFK